MIVQHRITGKKHTMPKAQYEAQTGAAASYIVVDDTDYIPDELKGMEAVAEDVKDNVPDAGKPVDGKAKARKPKSE